MSSKYFFVSETQSRKSSMFNDLEKVVIVATVVIVAVTVVIVAAVVVIVAVVVVIVVAVVESLVGLTKVRQLKTSFKLFESGKVRSIHLKTRCQIKVAIEDDQKRCADVSGEMLQRGQRREGTSIPFLLRFQRGQNLGLHASLGYNIRISRWSTWWPSEGGDSEGHVKCLPWLFEISVGRRSQSSVYLNAVVFVGAWFGKTCGDRKLQFWRYKTNKGRQLKGNIGIAFRNIFGVQLSTLDQTL
nr:hypothetical protein [Tanacetum cinerariifolium]